MLKDVRYNEAIGLGTLESYGRALKGHLSSPLKVNPLCRKDSENVDLAEKDEIG